mgnify:CR=1 FL=1
MAVNKGAKVWTNSEDEAVLAAYKLFAGQRGVARKVAEHLEQEGISVTASQIKSRLYKLKDDHGCILDPKRLLLEKMNGLLPAAHRKCGPLDAQIPERHTPIEYLPIEEQTLWLRYRNKTFPWSGGEL